MTILIPEEAETFTLDEEAEAALLSSIEELDRGEFVSEAEVLRDLTSDFLRLRREQEIDARYERAYANIDQPLGKEFEGWEGEGVWPPESS